LERQRPVRRHLLGQARGGREDREAPRRQIAFAQTRSRLSLVPGTSPRFRGMTAVRRSIPQTKESRMSNDLYQASVPQFLRMLGNLKAILEKAAAHAAAKKIDESAFLDARLYPDMFPLTKQVQIASDFTRGTTARLSGTEPPPVEDK